MAEIRHLENRHGVIFSSEGDPIWIKFRRLVLNDMSTAVMWSKSIPDVEFQYGGWNSYTLQCGTIMTLISPDDYTLQCGMWLWIWILGFQ